jgi:hypothetical protein
LTPSEKYVSEIGFQTFLSFWSFPSPRAKKGKELCDLLVVCGNDIIIFSVKDIIAKKTGNEEVDYKRWYRKAVEESIHQINGAERYLRDNDSLILNDAVTQINLPPKENRNYYRIAVAFGKGEEYPLIEKEDDTQKYVHIYDEEAFAFVLHELDTITDFVNFLRAKEKITETCAVIHPGEKHLLAFYLLQGREFPEHEGILSLDDDLWEGMLQDQRYLEWKTLTENSYVWDNLIKTLLNDHFDNTLINSISREHLEIVVRLMAKENRFERSRLSNAFIEFIGVKEKPQLASRIFQSLTDDSVVYVFVLGDVEKRKERIQELQIRTFIAKSLYPHKSKFIGIATEPYSKKGYSLDLHYLNLPEWKEEWKIKALEFIDTLGYFKNMKETIIKGSE